MWDDKRKKAGLLIVATVISLIFMGLSTIERSKATIVEDTLEVVVTPIQKIFSSVGNNIDNFFQFIKTAKNFKTENETLTQKVYEQQNEIISLKALKDENLRLREMLDYKERNLQLDFVGALVIAKDPSNWFNIFTIDLGTANGLKKNNAVLNSKGLIGHIYEIGTNWSKVITVIDEDSAVSCIIVRSRGLAVVKGDLTLQKDGNCKLTYISNDSDVIVGDVLETSGLGGIYPKGLKIGKVKEIKTEANGVSKYAVVEPFENLKKLEEVFVVK